MTISFIHGWLGIYKPYNMTSAHAVALVKKKFNYQKIGHAGTLDPLASGVLPLAIGEATKTVQYIMNERKKYLFEITWGERRSTDDLEGVVLEVSRNRPCQSEIENALSQFRGTIIQHPPSYSALKIKGQRACDLMRKNQEVHLSPRFVNIYNLELKKIVSTDCALFEIDCGKGTYVRAIARDLGIILDCLGYASAIDRIAVGNFKKKDALSIEMLACLDQNVLLKEYVKKIPEVLDDIPAVFVSETQISKLRQGQGIIDQEFGPSLDYINSNRPIFLCLDQSQKPIALVSLKDGKLWPERVFNI